MKEYASGFQKIFCLKSQINCWAAQPNRPDLGRICWASQLAFSMAINLGFQTKYFLNPRCMLFHPAKVLLKVFSISFKVLWPCCENQQKKKFDTTKDDIHVDIFTKEKKSCLINFYYSFQNCLQVQKVWLYEITFIFLIMSSPLAYI